MVRSWLDGSGTRIHAGGTSTVYGNGPLQGLSPLLQRQEKALADPPPRAGLGVLSQ
jgi:hypothetical protein